MWERACSRRRRVSSLMHKLTHCLREQARSHTWIFFNLLSVRPRQNRNRRYRILRTTLDQTIAVDQVNQRIALLVEEPHHLHGLEHQRSALLEHLFTILQLALEADRADLAASDGRLGAIFSQTQPTFHAASLGTGRSEEHTSELQSHHDL